MPQIFEMITAFLYGNSSLKFGYEWDRDYFITQQHYMPIIGSLTIHPIIFYLLLFDHRTMVNEIRMGYFFLYCSVVLDEWLFCFAFRVYMLPPYAAFYCEGPLCKSGWDTHWLMAIFAVPVVLVNCPFDFLVVKLHQMFVPAGNVMKLSTLFQTILFSLHAMLMIFNIVVWGISGIECDQSELLKAEPELSWLHERGGIIFMFGAPGDPQHFGKPLILLAITTCILAPIIAGFTLDAMRRVAKNSGAVSSGTRAANRRMLQVFFAQVVVAAANYVFPLFIMFAFMVIDCSWIPGQILALVVRFVAVVVYDTKSYAFGLFLFFKNPSYRTFLIKKAKQLTERGSTETRVRSTAEATKSLAK